MESQAWTTPARLLLLPRLCAPRNPKQRRRPAFCALQADTAKPPATTTHLYEFVRASDGKHAYTTDASWSKDGFHRSEHPLCLVWKNPMTMSIPINRYLPPDSN